MTSAPTYSRAPKETPASFNDIITVQSALATLLSEETIFINAMQMNKVAELQDRKLKLTTLLERYTRYMHQHPEVLERITVEEKAKLKETKERFHIAMKKNYDTLLVARSVNRAIVKCVTQSFAAKDSNPIYNARGATKPVYRKPLSLTLNETV
jgi:hypothetical protein